PHPSSQVAQMHGKSVQLYSLGLGHWPQSQSQLDDPSRCGRREAHNLSSEAEAEAGPDNSPNWIVGVEIIAVKKWVIEVCAHPYALIRHADLELTSTSSRGNDDLSSVGGILDGIAEQNLHEYGQLALISHHDGEIGIKHRSKR